MSMDTSSGSSLLFSLLGVQEGCCCLWQPYCRFNSQSNAPEKMKISNIVVLPIMCVIVFIRPDTAHKGMMCFWRWWSSHLISLPSYKEVCPYPDPVFTQVTKYLDIPETLLTDFTSGSTYHIQVDYYIQPFVFKAFLYYVCVYCCMNTHLRTNRNMFLEVPLLWYHVDVCSSQWSPGADYSLDMAEYR